MILSLKGRITKGIKKSRERERDKKVHARNIEEGKWRKLIIH